ncbi:cytochrome c1 [Burkholderia cepacia]|nr:cytochrome c1 [Burkholderia cepacia]
MKKLLSTLALIGATACALLVAPAVRAEGNFPLDRAPDNTENLVSLQHGAQLFVNYCLNCHSANLMRYNRLTDLGISQKEIEKNLLFTTDKVGNTMSVAMRPEDAKNWLGTSPPDLSVEERARPRLAVYVSAQLLPRRYAADRLEQRGVRERRHAPCTVAAGQRTAKFEDKTDEETGEKVHTLVGFQQVTPGTLSAVDYDAAVADLVAYMTWMSEPAQQTRKRLGVWVLIFLGVLTFLAWRLNAAYWKDIK